MAQPPGRRVRDELVADQTQMFHAADELRWTALHFERCATDIECDMARVQALHAS